ncbi:hypothetical protein BN7_5011 [Wickerhamomyces ciferrii]|uniref:Protein arginine methyltransferase NDUFAF7 n=1 Tax=Wickerhamomyces ciferrii (strain ATCC 14091 / BCRC 22168 / CBS 111 / JCM 3599 / NBRC 0793 / NRRL Y-1031 F-60-10) TaxID=1206466 RepID=K0KVF3_WICCF|nr:uncharacterized protein BN7_5011 [Wickerhamomyces ciferrii]CCH45429.1 hypothetical protein BN7_5011 [Wickerhamomyces ciferrii]
MRPRLPITRRTEIWRRLASSNRDFKHDYSHRPTTYNHRLPAEGEDPHSVDTQRTPITKVSDFTSFSRLWTNISNDPLKGQSSAEFFAKFPLVTHKKLAKRTERPKKVKMLASDFIDDSLYNPNYGYFPKQAEIFQATEPFNYNELQDTDEFVINWQKQYAKYDDSSKKELQLWHTPVELFQPHYGEAIARFLLVNYKLNLYPYHDLIIYEIGGGNGTLMTNILDYIRQMQPEVYKKTRYKIIDISKNLSEKQKKQSVKHGFRKHDSKVEIINKSIFDWKEFVPEPCFIVGLEVLDNLAHDMIKYDINTGKPYQGYVVIDEEGDYHQMFSPELSADSAGFLGTRGLDFLNTPYSKMNGLNHPLNENKFSQKWKNMFIPFNNSLSTTEFIPTRLYKLFEILNEKFPEHQVILSDFDSLPNGSEGYNSPVVQTILKEKAVTTSTFMVDPGFFDIMFPTNFHIIRDLYIKMSGKLIRTSKHSEFLEQWGDIEATTTKSGENPMLTFYQNASFLYN